MTVLELIRSAATEDDGSRRRPELQAAGTGAATAATGLAIPLLLTILAALAVPRASAGFGDALGSGTLLWLVLGGARLSFGEGTLAMTPLIGTLLLVLLARSGARRGLPEAPGPRLQGAWLGGYSGVGVLAALLGLLSPAAPATLSLVLPLLVVPALGLVWVHGLPDRLTEAWERAPVAVHRGLVPGVKGVLVTIVAGAVLVLLATGVHLGRVLHVHGELGAGFFGGLLLVLLQVALMPNLGIWAMSLAAGPGFSTAGGAMTTWSSAEAGVLPMVPALAAQPQPGGLPWVTHLLVLVPLLLGVWLGREALQRVPRLAATRSKLAVIAVAVVTTALGVGLLDVLAGGSLGADQLGDLGAPSLSLVLVLVLELGAGALAVLAREWWVLRR
ncbi:MAG: cell division protein PerM [Janibacter sp.]